MSTSPDREAQLARALGYPYPLTHKSFVFRAGSTDGYRLVDNADEFPDVSGRTAVLAVGSNQSPEQLARKFPEPEWGEIPTSRVHVSGFDSVYSAHITGYGSIAAMLFPMPGTTVSLYVNWLTDQQLEKMHETELPNENYTYGRLEDIDLRVEAGPELSSVNLYMGSRGAFAPDGNVIPLAKVPAEGRANRALSQTEILRAVQKKLAQESGFEEFIFLSISDPAQRLEFIEEMEKTSRHFQSKHYVA